MFNIDSRALTRFVSSLATAAMLGGCTSMPGNSGLADATVPRDPSPTKIDGMAQKSLSQRSLRKILDGLQDGQLVHVKYVEKYWEQGCRGGKCMEPKFFVADRLAIVEPSTSGFKVLKFDQEVSTGGGGTCTALIFNLKDSRDWAVVKFLEIVQPALPKSEPPK